MIENKFRVWASNDAYPNGKMYFPEENPDFVLNLHGDLIKSVDKGSFTSVNTWARISFNGIYIMQFTGLLDKNGKEAYSGDILQETRLDGRIFFYKIFDVDGGFAINIHQDDFKRDYIPFYQSIADPQTASWFSTLEIIGNVYENPELLTRQP